jgi:hypothetical protein
VKAPEGVSIEPGKPGDYRLRRRINSLLSMRRRGLVHPLQRQRALAALVLG